MSVAMTVQPLFSEYTSPLRLDAEVRVKNRIATAALLSALSLGAPLLNSAAELTTQVIAKKVPAPPAPFSPGMDDLMTMLVAPRHLKLYLAGTGQNWELASFQVKELRASLRRIGSTIPIYLERDVNETVAIMMEPMLKATESAIAAGSVERFSRSYVELTAACNACHVYLEHPFVIARTPVNAESAYPTQDFKSAP